MRRWLDPVWLGVIAGTFLAIGNDRWVQGDEWAGLGYVVAFVLIVGLASFVSVLPIFETEGGSDD